jgi:hypothetical protein
MKSSRKLALVLALGAVSGAGAVGAASPADAATLLSVSYEHKNYGGSHLNYTKAIDGFVCTDTVSDIDAYDSAISSTWNNRISSWRGYSNCATKVFDYTNFGGAAWASWDQDRADLGWMDNVASSIRWS